jgi:hypothetical protein
MSPENCKIIQDAVKEAGLALEGKLPPCKFLKKRNPYAHLWERIKHHMGKSYKECDDEQLKNIIELVEYYRNNPC